MNFSFVWIQNSRTLAGKHSPFSRHLAFPYYTRGFGQQSKFKVYKYTFVLLAMTDVPNDHSSSTVTRLIM